MEPLLISAADIENGANRAAYRLHQALRSYGVDSRMRVRLKHSDDWTVQAPTQRLPRALDMLRSPLGKLPLQLQTSENTNIRSCNWLPSDWATAINSSTFDILNLHWIGGETLSIADIGRIRKPVVWTLHDMWPFCGTEHYTSDDEWARWRSGYDKANRPATDTGLDVDRWVWRRKRHCWRHTMHIVCPSRWLADCARSSALFRNYPVTVIPNVLDTETYKPLEQKFCREALNLPKDKTILLFGAAGRRHDPRKGFDLLHQAIERLSTLLPSKALLAVLFGQGEPKGSSTLSVATHWVGPVYDDPTLALLYNAADVMIVPSRQENLPQTATEALACGCPVVAFDCTGLREAVDHLTSGFLARAYDAEDMAEGLRWVLEDTDRTHALGAAGRRKALDLWSAGAVMPQYLQVFQRALG